MKSIAGSTLKMDAPAIYQIEVLGNLANNWQDNLSGMNITSFNQGGDVTTLVGMLRDQAALAGVLHTLYELHLPVLLVKYIEQK